MWFASFAHLAVLVPWLSSWCLSSCDWGLCCWYLAVTVCYQKYVDSSWSCPHVNDSMCHFSAGLGGNWNWLLWVTTTWHYHKLFTSTSCCPGGLSYTFQGDNASLATCSVCFYSGMSSFCWQVVYCVPILCSTCLLLLDLCFKNILHECCQQFWMVCHISLPISSNRWIEQSSFKFVGYATLLLWTLFKWITTTSFICCNHFDIDVGILCLVAD